MNTIFTQEANATLSSHYASFLAVNGSAIACTGGERIHILSAQDLSLIAELDGHADKTEQVSFFEGSGSNALASCGADNTCKIWDLRQRACASTFFLDAEPMALSAGQFNDAIVAVGVENRVDLYDIRKGRKKFTFEEVHTDIVNSLRFHPFIPGILLSASEDNLVCQLDVQMCNEDEGVPWVINNEDNVRSFCVLGDSAKNYAIATASTTDVVRIWSSDCECLGEFGGIREHPLLKVDESCGYIVAMLWEEDRAYALGGSSEGGLGLFHLNCDSLTLWNTFAPGNTKEDEHTGVIRGAAQLGKGSLLTVDENGKLAAWRRREVECGMESSLPG